MNILIYTPTVGRGGVRRVVETLLRAFSETNHTFSVLGQTYDEHGTKVEYPKAWRFEQIDPVSRLPMHPNQFPFLMANCEAFVSHLRRVAPKYDLVYCPSAWWTMLSEKWEIGAPFVTTIPDLAFDELDMGALQHHFRAVMARLRERADSVVFLSRHWEQHARNVYYLQKTRLIPHSRDFVTNGFNPTPQEALRVRKKYLLTPEYVLAFHCFGHKDPATILLGQYYARSIAKTPPLVIAGMETGMYLPSAPITPGAEGHVREIRKIIRDMGAQLNGKRQDLWILGTMPEEDIAGLYAGATMAVCASKCEGDLPGTAFESVAARVPFVYSDHPVLIEKLGVDTNGYCFRRGDPASLGNTIVKVCNNREEAKRRADRAADLLGSRSVTNVASEYLALFEEIISCRRN